MTENTTPTNFGYWKDLLADAPASYREWFAAEEEFLRRNIPSGSRILEVGCGEGRSLEYISKLGRLYGVDYNPQAVVEAGQRFFGIPEVSVLMENGKDLPFRDQWFDRTICLTTPVNFGKDRDQFYSEMRRVTKDDGAVLLSVFNEDQSTFEERMKFYKICQVPIIKVDGTTVHFDYPHGASSSEQFSRDQLEEIFRENGFVPVEISKKGIGYFCLVHKQL